MKVVILCVTLFFIVVAQEEPKVEYYPAKWAQINIKTIIDNRRLYNKYKKCFFEEDLTGCPRDMKEMKAIIPEVIDTLCAKCSPDHIKAGKAAAKYMCETHKDDVDRALKLKDPDGTILARFEAKFGKMACD